MNVSLFQFTRYLHCLASLPFSIYMIFTGFGPPKFTCYLQGIEQPHISHLHVLYMFCLKNLQDIYKEDTVNLFPKIYMLFTWFFKL